jgi:hypothetical protein
MYIGYLIIIRCIQLHQPMSALRADAHICSVIKIGFGIIKDVLLLRLFVKIPYQERLKHR